ncbi:hypothetical protein GLOIN_2v1785498 [Rhizophagus clarus]|uniref:Uncharacterized protein n=1 Tax=Rhizophagus clarus TaxID=94130 RepID=A0A8H3M0D7_9GLOM|nr:hypothetical protein GLOIN_2v1785498 [Rhizophagus clarus]
MERRSYHNTVKQGRTYGTDFSEVVQSDVSSITVANEVLRRNKSPQLKPLELCNKSTIYKKQRKFGCKPKEQVQVEGAKIYSENQVVLKQISYNVNSMDFQIDYNRQKNNKEKEDILISLVQVIDQNHISHEGYRSLATIEPNLERE